MQTKTQNFPALEFQTEQIATFAPLVATIEALAQERRLRVSRTFDRDPLGTFAAYFFDGWSLPQPRICFIGIYTTNPLNIGTEFYVSACYGLRRNKKWSYSSQEGSERFVTILAQAEQFLIAEIESSV